MSTAAERLRKWYEAAMAASDDAEKVLRLLNEARVKARDNPEQWAFEERDRRARCETLMFQARAQAERAQAERAQAERDRWRVRAEAAEARISEIEETLKGLGQ